MAAVAAVKVPGELRRGPILLRRVSRFCNSKRPCPANVCVPRGDACDRATVAAGESTTRGVIYGAARRATKDSSGRIAAFVRLNECLRRSQFRFLLRARLVNTSTMINPVPII